MPDHPHWRKVDTGFPRDKRKASARKIMRKRQRSLFYPLGLAKRRLLFVGSDRFHQGHELALHGLVLDFAVGSQKP